MQRVAFYYKLVRSKRTDLPLRLGGTVPRQNNYRLFEINTAYLLQNRDPIEPWHSQIKKYGIGVLLAIELQALPTIISE